MTVLSQADRAKHFPLVMLTGDALVGALEHAQAIAEQAALRPLGLTQFTETVEIPPSRQIPLKYLPIVTTSPIVVEAESYLGQGFKVLDENRYELRDGFLVIFSQVICRRVRISYSSGLQNDPAVKAAIAAILYFQLLR